MLIICSGPETFLARQKVRELVEAYRQKHDSSGLSIEHLEHQTSLTDALNKLGNLGFFASKKFLKYENLLAGISPAQAKQLAKLLTADANQTIVLTYEDKLPTKKILDLLPKGLVFTYQYEKIEGRELDKWVAQRCKSYGLSTELKDRLVRLYSNDLWSIDTTLQMLQDADDITHIQAATTEDSVFAIIDQYFRNDTRWRKNAQNFDDFEILAPLISQLVAWRKIKSGCTDGIHPYVQKKLSNTELDDAANRTLSALRGLYATRHSLAQGHECLQIID